MSGYEGEFSFSRPPRGDQSVISERTALRFVRRIEDSLSKIYVRIWYRASNFRKTRDSVVVGIVQPRLRRASAASKIRHFRIGRVAEKQQSNAIGISD